VIELQGVSKVFRIYDSPGQRLLDWITPKSVSFHRPFWSLRDVSFKLAKGRSVGIIGANGAGKSTLLKLIAGISTPTTGSIRVEGKVAALLELGAGFHPEFSGRDNLAMNARMLGLTEAEIAARLPDMIAFAELGRFIDQPVRTYSSGMYVRLGFAAASGIDPEVLIIDEALSVGDAYFQRKSLERIRQFREQGKTILVVSHAMDVVRRFCDEAIWLDQGRVRAIGEVNSVVRAYEMHCKKQEEVTFGASPAEETAASVLPTAPGAGQKRFRVLADSWGNGKIRITKVEMVGEDGLATWMFNQDDAVSVRLHYYAMMDSPAAVFGLNFHTENGIYLFGANNFHRYHQTIPVRQGPGCLEIKLPRLSLHAGRYLLTVGCHIKPDEPFWSDFADYHFQAYKFGVWSETTINGLVDIPAQFVPRDQVYTPDCGIPSRLAFSDRQTPHYLFGEWWEAEEGEAGHVCWTGGDAGFLLHIPMEAQAVRIDLWGGRSDLAARPAALKVVTGQQVLAEVSLNRPDWSEVLVPVPAELRGRVLQGRLVVEPVWSPSEYGVAEDTRTLGVCVRSIQAG
jgi:lipopolysaccharide transport system ATP-binding protein